MKTLVLLLVVTVSAETSFLQANNKFSSTLYKEITNIENGNFLASPYSAEAILALTLAGARGSCAEELQKATYLADPSFQQIPEAKEYTFKATNKIYVQEDFQINETFSKLAFAEKINFIENKKATETINKWVEQETANKIKDLISSDTITNDTRVILVNAAYLKAAWLKPFKLSLTGQIDFYKNDNSTVKVDALHSRPAQKFLFYNCPHSNAKFLELPFKGRDASMTFILPNNKDGLNELESQIDKILELQNLTETSVKVVLPKFKIETKVDLKEILQNLGVKAIFSAAEADLSGIAGQKGDLVVGKVLQKTFLDLNEEGIEAAAATFSDVIVPRIGFKRSFEEFVADHPFLFYVKIQDIIVFVGRVIDPSL